MGILTLLVDSLWHWELAKTNLKHMTLQIFAYNCVEAVCSFNKHYTCICKPWIKRNTTWNLRGHSKRKSECNVMHSTPSPPKPSPLYRPVWKSWDVWKQTKLQLCWVSEMLQLLNKLRERITIVGLHTNHSPFIAGSILEVFVVTKDSWRLTLLCSGTCSETIHTGFF